MGGAIQNSYGKMSKGYKGQVSNSNPAVTVSKPAIGDVRVGTFVSYSADGVSQIASDNQSVLAGVAVKSTLTTGDIIENHETVTVAKKASIFVYCETGCVAGESVYVRHTDNADLLAGDVRNDEDTDKAFKHPTAIFTETVTSASLVEINL